MRETTTPGPGPRTTAIWLVLLLGLIAFEVACYPWIASWLYARATGHGWSGAGLRYFQSSRILPAGIALALFVSALVLWTQRRSPRFTGRAILIAWALNLLALGSSVAWYAILIGPLGRD